MAAWGKKKAYCDQDLFSHTKELPLRKTEIKMERKIERSRRLRQILLLTGQKQEGKEVRSGKSIKKSPRERKDGMSAKRGGGNGQKEALSACKEAVA